MAKNNSELKSIQKKLMAAIAMVLVASVMVVSSSYAWFTLSTAPEVTGIQTSVGSNGNLEMALMPSTGLLSDITTGGTGSSNNFPASNTFWGNLVNLSDPSYGMTSITLAPARLNSELVSSKTIEKVFTIENTENAYKAGHAVDGTYNGEKITALSAITEVKEGDTVTGYTYEITTTSTIEEYRVITGSGFLQTPEYGTDGRIEKLNANTVNGIYDVDDKAFGENGGYGVRAVGVTSNISPEALALRNAKSTVNNAIDSAKSSGSKSMKNYAVPMAGIIVQHELNSGYTYDNDDYLVVKNAIDDLTKVINSLENAMKEAVVAVGLSQGKTFTSDKVTITSTAITVDGYEIDWDGADADEDAGIKEIPDRTTQKNDLMAAAAKIATMRQELETSTNALANVNQTTPEFDLLKTAMAPLVSATGIKIVSGTNEYTMNDDMMLVAAALFTGSATIKLTDGLYADVAEFVGDYSQGGLSMTVDANNTDYVDMVNTLYPGSNGVATVNFTMGTEATVPTNGYHLVYVSTWMASVGLAKESGGSSLITDTYGYIVDLAFRTNAAGSSLLLQTDATDRVSNSNGEDSVTMGGGSYMTFGTDNADFTLAQLVNLMDYIRVVIVDPSTGNIYGIAKLDVGSTLVSTKFENVESETQLTVGGEYNGSKITALGAVTENTVTATDGTTTTTYTYASVTADVATPNYTVDANNNVTAKLYLHSFSINNGVIEMGAKLDGVITELEQNTAKALSALVFLDGDKVENKDVAISGNSMKGTMNLQFASSATLVPMDYTFSEKETLSAPSIKLDGDKLTITPAEDAPASGVKYEIYVDAKASGVEVDAGTIENLQDKINNQSGQSVTANITVVAKHADYNNSPASNAVQYTITADQASGT